MEERRWMPSPEGLSGGILGLVDKVVSWAVVVGLALIALVIFIQVAARVRAATARPYGRRSWRSASSCG